MAEKELVDAAVKIILQNFGSYTAKLYETAYLNKSKDEIIASLTILLMEFVGPENAKKQLEPLTKMK